MKASDVITVLQKQILQHGDLDVTYPDTDYGCARDFDIIEMVNSDSDDNNYPYKYGQNINYFLLSCLYT